MKTEAIPSIGEVAPDVSWTHPNGEQICLSDFRGTPVVLAFFSTSWDPGRDHQLELFRQLISETSPEIEFLSVNSDATQIEATLDGRTTVQIPVFDALDPIGPLARELGVYGQEALLVIDENGVIAYRFEAGQGSLPLSDELMAALASLPQRNVSRRQFVFTAAATLAAIFLLPKAEAFQLGTSEKTARGLPLSTYTLNINGRDHKIPADPRITVLNALRDYLGMTGTKKGCDHGQCGACTVHLNGRRVNSCLLLAAQAEGSAIRTIEGLAHGDQLHPVQEAFIEHDGFQCGYCTPGQIMSAVECIKEGHTGSPEEIREWMSGNICRCGAYQGILEAVQTAKAKMGVA